MHYWGISCSPLEAASGYVRLYGGGVIPQLFEGYGLCIRWQQDSQSMYCAQERACRRTTAVPFLSELVRSQYLTRVEQKSKDGV
jgi:hypothetical protein